MQVHSETLAARRGRKVVGLAVAASLLTLTGCSLADNVEFQGKLFEVAGLTGSLGEKTVPKTETRPPLILPPAGQTLQPPGENVAALTPPPPAEQNPAWPQDPDKAKASEGDRNKKAQEAYCKDGNWRKKAMADEIGADQGPHGRCTGSIFSVLGNTLFGQ